jgi:hypothetical protein
MKLCRRECSSAPASRPAPAVIRAQGERASRRFIEFFTANLRNRNTRAAYARAMPQRMLKFE